MFLSNLPNELLAAIVQCIGPDWYYTAAMSCARLGAIITRQSNHNISYRIPIEVCVYSLPLAKWSHKNMPPGTFKNKLCNAAASRGQLDVLQWARANDYPWDGLTCACAALNGHLAVLQWARDNGCPWNEKTCANAAENGHLTVLQWARANGCPCSKFTNIIMLVGGHKEVVQWARANGVLK